MRGRCGLWRSWPTILVFRRPSMSHRVATNVITNARVADPRRRGQLIASDAAHPAFLPFNVAFPVSFLGQLFARESHVIMFREHLYAVERSRFSDGFCEHHEDPDRQPAPLSAHTEGSDVLDDGRGIGELRLRDFDWLHALKRSRARRRVFANIGCPVNRRVPNGCGIVPVSEDPTESATGLARPASAAEADRVEADHRRSRSAAGFRTHRIPIPT